MEFVNKVELVGVVGNVKVTEFAGGASAVARLSVCTNSLYKGNDNSVVINTTWHNVVAFEGKNICDLSTLAKGDKVRVIGQIRNNKYTGTDGVERYTNEINAKTLEKLDVDNLSIPS